MYSATKIEVSGVAYYHATVALSASNSDRVEVPSEVATEESLCSDHHRLARLDQQRHFYLHNTAFLLAELK